MERVFKITYSNNDLYIAFSNIKMNYNNISGKLVVNNSYKSKIKHVKIEI